MDCVFCNCSEKVAENPHGDSAERLLGALLMEQDETWSTGRLYFDMRAYLEWKQGQGALGIGDAVAAVAGS
jgi:hypothetical protein